MKIKRYPRCVCYFCDALCEEALIAKGITRDIPDLDRDGSLDNSDTDDNNDGAVDADSDSNGLIDIYTLKQLDAIRFDLHGASRKLSVLDPGDSSGCPLVYTADAKLVPRCHGYELKIMWILIPIKMARWMPEMSTGMVAGVDTDWELQCQF